MGSIATIDDKTVSKIELQALSISERARAIHIENDQDAVYATGFLNDVVNPFIKGTEELFKPLTDATYDAWQKALAIKKKAMCDAPAAKEDLRIELGRWVDVVKERDRIERLRIEQEARDREAQRIEREIAAVKASGDPDADEQIQAILEMPQPLVLPPAASSAPVPGARAVYEVVVYDLREFYRAIGDGRIPATMAEPKQSALKAMARAHEGKLNYPGCRVNTSSIVNSRSSR